MAAACSALTGGETMVRSLRSEYGHGKARDEKVYCDDQDRRSHDRLRGGSTYALCTSPCADPVVTPDTRDNEAEEQGLEEAHEYVLVHQNLPGARPVLVHIYAKEQR